MDESGYLLRVQVATTVIFGSRHPEQAHATETWCASFSLPSSHGQPTPLLVLPVAHVRVATHYQSQCAQQALT
jgi:hypothetical protein